MNNRYRMKLGSFYLQVIHNGKHVPDRMETVPGWGTKEDSTPLSARQLDSWKRTLRVWYGTINGKDVCKAVIVKRENDHE